MIFRSKLGFKTRVLVGVAVLMEEALAIDKAIYLNRIGAGILWSVISITVECGR
jgi:hypothetical protein